MVSEVQEEVVVVEVLEVEEWVLEAVAQSKAHWTCPRECQELG